MKEPDVTARVIRFGVFEVDLRTAELRKQGVRIRLAGQSFQVLETLLLRPGELVTREELKQKLWPSDSFGDFEHGINTAVNRVREALGDSSDNPRFVETLPRRGYRFIAPVNGVSQSAAAGLLHNVVPITPSEPPQTAPEPPPPKPRISKLAAVIAVLACMIAAFAALLIARWGITPAVPVVESVTQLTDDGQPKGAMSSDGSRVYFEEGTILNRKIAQVSVTGGPTVPVETRFASCFLVGVAHGGTDLYVAVPDSAVGRYSPHSFLDLWSLPLPAGDPRRLGSCESYGAFGEHTVDLLSDGRIIFGQNIPREDVKGTGYRTQWFIADKDGSNPRKLLSLPGLVGYVTVSPDGRKIVLSQEKPGDRRLVEIAPDGTGLREIRKLGGDERNFRWTAEEKYLVYQSGSDRKSNIWLLPMKTGIFRHVGNPIRLTNGPMPYSKPYPSLDGRQIFVLGTKERGELIRYDMKSHQFLPFLSGISATNPTFSRDGKWVAYVTFSDHTLWRSRSDGTERMQLTFPPMDVGFPVISPDGTKVSFHTDKLEVFVISMEGGIPQKVSDSGWFASWSPDGNYLFYQGGHHPWPSHIIDARTGKNSADPPPKGYFGGGFWLTQDILVGRNEKYTNFVTFNLKTQQLNDLSPSPLSDIENWMISPDAKYLYYTTGGPEPKVMRLRVADRQLETITSLKDVHRAASGGFAQINVAPDGSPILTRDTGYQEIYALNIRWP
jgi:DNA-binding winged helix-turn-helix (wHTH) protein/Tol biopolymer transport system component